VRRVPVPVVIGVAAAVVLASLGTRVGDWAVMTDELLYERLALSIAQTGSPVPTLHGEHVGVLAQLYPLLLAPVYVAFALPTAVLVAHGWNGILFASATVPAYLLARRIVPHWMAVAIAIGAVAIPWSVLTGFLMTENAAYPAFLWAALAIQRAVVEPGHRNDALGLGAIALAALARPQLAILGLAFGLTAFAHELRFGRRWRDHRVALGAFALGTLVLVAAAAAGSAGALLGSYAPTVQEGSLLSRAALRSAAVHLDVVGIALGLVPLLLGGGWALQTLVRERVSAELHAFAAFVVATGLLLTLEVGSFVSRFALGLDVKDRYLFYLAPLLLLATAAALVDPRVPTAGLFAATAFFVLTVGWETFEPVFGVNLDSPGSVLHESLSRRAGDVGISVTTLLELAGGVVAVALIFMLRALPRRPLGAAILVAVLVFCALETGYTWGRLLESNGPSGAPIASRPTDAKSWIDRSVPAGADVGMLAHSVAQDWFPSAVTWWNVEFWNARVTRAYIVGGWFYYTPDPFPRPTLRVDFATGALVGDPPPYLVRTTVDSRFRPVGPTVGVAPDLEVVRLDSPARAAWATRGLAPDGWTRRGIPAVLRVYGDGLVDVRMTVSAPDAPVLRSFNVGPVTGVLEPNEVRELEFSVCAKPHGDLPIGTDSFSAARKVPRGPPYARHFRFVGIHLARISTTPASGACS
jgi:hypothetical protein